MRPDTDTTLNLNRLALLSGQGKQLDLTVDTGDFELGGHVYAHTSASLPARLAVSKTVAGYALHLEFTAEVAGPCMRCLRPAKVLARVDAREVDQPPSDDEAADEDLGELASPYVDGSELALQQWARDALLLALPDPILCRPDCPGLCPVCGEALEGSDPEAHQHETGGDPRWAKLDQLKDPAR